MKISDAPWTVTLTGKNGDVEITLAVTCKNFIWHTDTIITGHANRFRRRIPTGWRTIMAAGTAPSEQVSPFVKRPVQDRTVWPHEVSLTITHPDVSEPINTTLKRAEVTVLRPGEANDGEPIANVTLLVHGHKWEHGSAAVEPIAFANCMLCGTEDNPGQVVRGVKGDVIVLCDPCRESLATNQEGVPLAQPGGQ